MYPVYRFSSTEDPSHLTKALWRHKIAHQIAFNDGHNELWLNDPNQLDKVEEIIAQWKQDPLSLASVEFAASTSSATSAKGQSFFSRPFHTPVTLILILLSAFVAMFTQLGADLTKVGYFTISAIEVHAGQLYAYNLPDIFSTGEYWRLVTPAFLHFGIVHLVFNALWIWDIGRRLESLLGSTLWLVGVLVIAVASNVLQYLLSGYPLFGGLSGVVYGMIGFAYLYPILNKQAPNIISKPLLAFFVIWLGVGYTPLPELLGLGSIANTAHAIGLATGLLLALVYGVIHKLISR
ncbi:rhomboid family intramembrane serine protease [Marinomonas sp. C2222]|uniref:Rhomboid family intramembrane serine protease n=1 Tax=Marinomonas sargassi TaxID=2984494 RepID=A0ABT2YS87_9GAMM|nr:rhomboid family intramembrane serine protease [Marinomonas sargassi]MCV2402748.1 rhomboid family intramembrane serine protease [Marinomonas sargassi]